MIALFFLVHFLPFRLAILWYIEDLGLMERKFLMVIKLIFLDAATLVVFDDIKSLNFNKSWNSLTRQEPDYISFDQGIIGNQCEFIGTFPHHLRKAAVLIEGEFS